MPDFVTVTAGVPVVSVTLAVAVIFPALPASPLSPLSPLSPFSPCAPVSPLMLVKAKSKLGFSAVPDFVIVTAGVPVVLLTLPVAVMTGVAPVAPVSPVSPLSPLTPFRLLKAKSKLGFSAVPDFVTVTAGVPVVSPTLAVAVMTGVAPVAPVSPVSPLSPLAPVAPVSPFRLLKAKSKLGLSVVPVLVTATDGTPTVLLTLAVAVTLGVAPVAPVAPVSPLSPLSPLSPVSPLAPCGMPKSNTALTSSPTFSTVALSPAASVVTAPTVIVDVVLFLILTRLVISLGSLSML